MSEICVETQRGQGKGRDMDRAQGEGSVHDGHTLRLRVKAVGKVIIMMMTGISEEKDSNDKGHWLVVKDGSQNRLQPVPLVGIVVAARPGCVEFCAHFLDGLQLGEITSNRCGNAVLIKFRACFSSDGRVNTCKTKGKREKREMTPSRHASVTSYLIMIPSCILLIILVCMCARGEGRGERGENYVMRQSEIGQRRRWKMRDEI